ncbi:MAG TPA: Crp/Fnr family transcriptional regulator [Candidatus Tumulicola sp.]|jgi:CRP-like cAMP-binding protein
MAPVPEKTTTGNLFLDHLPPQVLAAIRPSLTFASFRRGETIFESDAAYQRVLFPIGSIVSIVLEMLDGSTAEVGLIGREGMTGLSIVLGQAAAQQRAIVQVPDSAQCLSVSDLRDLIEREPELKASMLRYAQATINTGTYLSACNSLHATNERCARWLLMAHDRVSDDVILLTQEFLSQMLGVQRTGVNVAAGALQEAGFISYARGHITIRNRRGLESAACECYERIDQAWQTVMGYSTKKTSWHSAHRAHAIHADGQA